MSFFKKIFGKQTEEDETMAVEKLNIGIILGSTRE
ncbi:NADPH-dependent oxidoreductase, partial [Mesorhizobium sp. M7A.F.Ca.MR.362.00.0.0]